MYIDFKEVAAAFYHQADDDEEEPKPSAFPKRRVEWEQNISESDDDGAYDDADDEHLSNTVVGSQHLFGEPSFMHALDFETMHAPEFLKYTNFSM